MIFLSYIRPQTRQLLANSFSFALFLSLLFFATNSQAVVNKPSKKDDNLPSILKADAVNGNQETNVITADGNVELSKGSSIIYSDQMVYDKNNAKLRAIGNVKVKNIEVGNLVAKEIEMKDDFSEGVFLESKIIMADGSYLVSPKINRKTPLVTVLQKPTYSICPNDDIKEDNELAGQKRDFLSIKSSKTKIDRDKQFVAMNHAIIRFYDVPFLYTPFLQFTLPSRKRESGFLHPSYTKSNKIGIGVKIPYYFNIAPNKDLVLTPHIQLNNDQFVIKNEFRHLTNYGEYGTMFEFANNKITSPNDAVIKDRPKKDYRWRLNTEGGFDFTTNTGLDFLVNTISDRNYSRDYHNDYVGYTVSAVNLDYINTRDYYAIRTIRIQELENIADQAPLILPSIDSHIESKPQNFNQKFVLTSNLTAINRESGLQYRRLSAAPEVNLPINLHGNLVNMNAKVEGDFYSLENNFQYSDRSNDYNSLQSNYKPQFTLGWSLPLIKKSEENSLLIEPMANFVVSSYTTGVKNLPNEDSNNAQLTINNLFNPDRVAGFDRNESGERISYGVKSSLFNTYGEYGLTLGQSVRKNNKIQDISIRGFNENDKSNVVGGAYYNGKKYLNIYYNFHLDESNYRNDLNELGGALRFEKFTFASSFILLRKNKQNPQEVRQVSAATTMKLGNRWSASATATKDLVIGRVLSKTFTLYRDGCCTTVGVAVTVNNPSNLIRPETSYNLNFSVKNL